MNINIINFYDIFDVWKKKNYHSYWNSATLYSETIKPTKPYFLHHITCKSVCKHILEHDSITHHQPKVADCSYVKHWKCKMSNKEHSPGSEEGTLMTNTPKHSRRQQWVAGHITFSVLNNGMRCECVTQHSGTLPQSSVGNIACNVHLVNEWMIRGGYILW